MDSTFGYAIVVKSEIYSIFFLEDGKGVNKHRKQWLHKNKYMLVGGTVQYREWSPLSTARDPVKSRGIEWISGMDGKFAENLTRRAMTWIKG